ncbi:MAG: hypothetical protein ACREYC_23285 [Gammaproteobacteria bacterium]
MKTTLDEVARREQASVSKLLEKIVTDWLAEHRYVRDDAEQRRLHAAAAATFGTFQGGDPNRSANVRQALRAKLRQRRAR